MVSDTQKIINEIKSDKEDLERAIIKLMNDFENKWKILRVQAVVQHNLRQTPEWDAMICNITISIPSL